MATPNLSHLMCHYRWNQFLNKVGVLIFAAALLLVSREGFADNEIKLKILAVNPSPDKSIDSDITYTLPQEIKPANVLNSAGLDVKYNQDDKVYYLSGKVKLQPKESKTLEVLVSDVWRIDPEEFDAVRAALKLKKESLIGTKYAETGELLYQKALAAIDQIETEQSSISGIRRRIEFHRGAVKRLNQVKNNVLSIEAIRGAESNLGDEERTAKFQITAQNPSAEARTMTVRADLPRDIESEHVLDKGGFELLFDANKSRYVVERKDNFAGRESKTYEIELKDIWYITQKEINLNRDQALELNQHFSASNYADFADGVTAEVKRLLNEIEALQEEVGGSSAIQDRIRAFTLNSQKMNIVRSRIKELQDLLLDLPITTQPKPVVESTPEGVREIQKIKDVSKILSMGIKPDLSTTWWLILGIIGFLMIFATIFYVVWIHQLKKNAYKGGPEDGGTA